RAWVHVNSATLHCQHACCPARYQPVGATLLDGVTSMCSGTAVVPQRSSSVVESAATSGKVNVSTSSSGACCGFTVKWMSRAEGSGPCTWKRFHVLLRMTVH